MNFDLPFFLCALGLAFVLEGLPYFLWAEKMPSVLAMLSRQSPSGLRRMGALALLAGLVLVFLGRSL
jgi:hypothetical protein